GGGRRGVRACETSRVGLTSAVLPVSTLDPGRLPEVLYAGLEGTMRRGLHPLVLICVLGNMFGCGNGCSCMAPIPGGSPPSARTPKMGQIRVSSSGLASVSSNPAALVSALTGGPLQFNVPSSCGGTPALCCPGGSPQDPCGPINIDLAAQAGDDP